MTGGPLLPGAVLPPGGPAGHLGALDLSDAAAMDGDGDVAAARVPVIRRHEGDPFGFVGGSGMYVCGFNGHDWTGRLQFENTAKMWRMTSRVGITGAGRTMRRYRANCRLAIPRLSKGSRLIYTFPGRLHYLIFLIYIK